ncbi:MAG: FtsX-like permease family protein, partial [Thermoanaerobaculia bacterium]|nr:FtsX-like permease family protein [Thermoanaerobaculia bacterium]
SDVAYLTRSSSSGQIYLSGSRSEEPLRPLMNTVSPEFFSTLEIPLVRGRTFDERDREGAPGVVVLNQAAARELFGADDPIGRRLGRTPEDRETFEVVGVVSDTRYLDVRSDPPPTLYWAHAQRQDGRGRVFEVRTAGPPGALVPAVRDAVRAIDPTLPLMDVTTQEEAVEERLAQERLFALATSLFGALALLLAAVGLFGLVSYAVGQRTHEFGVRMALGAERGDVRSLVLSESLRLAAVGLALGVVASLGCGRFLEAFLYGVAPTHPPTLGLAVAVILAAATLASVLPARRAARVDPVVAIRRE